MTEDVSNIIMLLNINQYFITQLRLNIFTLFKHSPFLFQFKSQKGKLPPTFFTMRQPVAQTKQYMNAREVTEFFMLPPGEYLIVPTTFKPNETASFLLTILSKSETHVQ